MIEENKSPPYFPNLRACPVRDADDDDDNDDNDDVDVGGDDGDDGDDCCCWR